MLNFKLLLDVTMLVRFSWLRTQVQELEHVILIPGIMIKIVFVESSINDADIFTKNLGKEACEKHVNKFLGEMQDSNLEYRG
jgi:hypothetical protein